MSHYTRQHGYQKGCYGVRHVNHTNSRVFMSVSPSPTWLCSVATFFTSKTAVALFVMIMGALLRLIPPLRKWV